MRKVIVDSSCLILYEKIGKLDILRQVFPQLIATREVAEECGLVPSWIKVESAVSQEKYADLAIDLGKGEASSIALALETDHSLLIIDEKKGRSNARDLHVAIVGSLGLLLVAKKMKVIDSVKEIIDLIDDTNFRISPLLREKVLREANE